MRKLFTVCAPRPNWKAAAVLAVAVLAIGVAVGAKAGFLAVLGATPLLAMAMCLVPCLIPFALFRGKGKERSSAIPTNMGCTCGSGTETDCCRAPVSTATAKQP